MADSQRKPVESLNNTVQGLGSLQLPPSATMTAVPGSVNLKLIACLACLVLTLLSRSAAEPIKITFDGCVPGLSNNVTQYCCPPKYNGTIVDFIPEKELDSSKPLRVRKALQCLTGKEQQEYKAKLDKAYTILRNLPKDDPRSLDQHGIMHCAYAVGALVQPGTNITIDIHFSWLFYPFHRWFVFFHERILQHVLEDPEFSLHFWNWDNGDTVPKPDGSDGGCYEAGNFLPPLYNDSSTAQYVTGRSNLTRIPGLPVDLSVHPLERENPPLRTADVVLPRNLESMYGAMMSIGNTTRHFMGREYRYGDSQVLNPFDGTGTLEIMGHAATHWWVGGLLGAVETSAADPLFFTHHSNIDRLWKIWHNLPGGERKDYDDPDFLNAEFLFWDENAALRRVKVKDALSNEALGYCYETANDAYWINYVPPVNGTSNYTASLPFPYLLPTGS
ncbi:hypothetical protein R1sor_011333 [Riccia sorocarpa]|uniref:Tyrosinase copper-binding domain-containing protein n=1 Tax=Riccia sorocarpa TaxID=122646 RepID=A0ABD3I4E3_9MARC